MWTSVPDVVLQGLGGRGAAAAARRAGVVGEIRGIKADLKQVSSSVRYTEGKVPLTLLHHLGMT